MYFVFIDFITDYYNVVLVHPSQYTLAPPQSKIRSYSTAVLRHHRNFGSSVCPSGCQVILVLCLLDSPTHVLTVRQTISSLLHGYHSFLHMMSQWHRITCRIFPIFPPKLQDKIGKPGVNARSRLPECTANIGC